MVNVTRENFLEASNDLLQHLPTAAFVAIDEEMTGIQLPGTPRPAKDDTPQQRYQTIKKVPERYAIIQVGVALFHQHPDYDPSVPGSPGFAERRYNFYLFPPSSSEREVTMNPSAVAFLNQHNMNFDRWTKEGISFCTTTMADSILQKYERDMHPESSNSSSSDITTPRRVQLVKQQDIAFHARALASLREWVDSASTGNSLLLPRCNRFLRRALYESIEVEYPSLVLENAGPEHYDQIRVWRLTPQERRERDKRLAREKWERMVLEVGFCRVFMALSHACRGYYQKGSPLMARSIPEGQQHQVTFEPLGRKIPVVVHNGLMDFLFLLTHFHSHALPDDFQQAKALIHDYFPLVYDTKVLATECIRFGESTALGNLFSKVVGIEPSPSDQVHEASYDAYMTGMVFIALSTRIKAEQNYMAPEVTTPNCVASLSHILASSLVEKKLFGRNKLHYMMTLYTIDLENPSSDPMSRGMSPSSTYRVSGIDPSTTTSDIIQCLTGSSNFEIVWVDKTTFMVAACNENTIMLERNGNEIEAALHRRFPSQHIVSLEEHLEQLAREGRGDWITWFWGLFSGRKRSGENEQERSGKRRRM